MVEVSLTVGKVDASLAILTTADHYVIEFPTVLLPESVEAGSVVTINVEQDVEQEKKQKEKFQSVQEQILAKYGTDGPTEPVLHLANATQTSCVIRWDPIHLGSSQLKSLILYKQGNRQQVIAPGSHHDPLGDNSLKISGLSVDVEYEFKLLLNTSSGKFWSNSLKVHTHKMTDMSGITVCVGPKTNLGGHVSIDQIKSSLEKIGAKPLQDHVTLETTHFIATQLPDNEGARADEELARASDNNIPIVRPEWIRACELEKRIVGVRDFYLDLDPSNFSNYKFTEGSVADSLPKQTVADDAVADDAVPEKTVQEESVPKETAPEETVEAETILEETIQEVTAPEETAPVETAPEETAPEETAPEETAPEETAPEETAPEETAPEETAPEEIEPVVIEEISLEEPVVEEQVLEEPASEEPVLHQVQEEAVPVVTEKIPLEEPTPAAALEAPLETVDNSATEIAEESVPAPIDSTEIDGDSAQPQTEETSPEAEDVTKNSSAGTSNTSSKKKNKKKKKGKK